MNNQQENEKNKWKSPITRPPEVTENDQTDFGSSENEGEELYENELANTDNNTNQIGF